MCVSEKAKKGDEREREKMKRREREDEDEDEEKRREREEAVCRGGICGLVSEGT